MSNLETWPKRIYLQIGYFEVDPQKVGEREHDYTYDDCGSICWCEGRMYKNDVEYVRADLVKEFK